MAPEIFRMKCAPDAHAHVSVEVEVPFEGVRHFSVHQQPCGRRRQQSEVVPAAMNGVLPASPEYTDPAAMLIGRGSTPSGAPASQIVTDGNDAVAHKTVMSTRAVAASWWCCRTGRVAGDRSDDDWEHRLAHSKCTASHDCPCAQTGDDTVGLHTRGWGACWGP